MAFSGAGVFSRIHNWISDRDNGIKITAVRHDAEDDGFATGLSNCICRDGQSVVTAAIPFSAQRITGLGNATADTDAVNRQTGDERWANQGECYLSQGSTTTVFLARKNGKKLIINGLAYDVPVGGVSYSLVGLTPFDLYNVYAYMSGATMTLEASATAPTTDATSGVQIKTGDASRTFVGRFLPDTATTMVAESGTIMRVQSYYQRKTRAVAAAITAFSTASTSYVQATGSALGVLGWSDEIIQANFTGYAACDTEFIQILTSMGSGGASYGGEARATTGGGGQTGYVNASLSIGTIRDGAYEYDLRCAVSSGTPPPGGTWTGYLSVWTRG